MKTFILILLLSIVTLQPTSQTITNQLSLVLLADKANAAPKPRTRKQNIKRSNQAKKISKGLIRQKKSEIPNPN